MPMNPRLLRPTSTSGHPEANAWRTAVVSNGGSVSTTTFQAVSTFCAAIDAAGIRDRFYRLNLFAGTGLNAALVPLYRGQSRTGTQYGNTTDTNVGTFVSSDYNETGASSGLKGNGSSKYLNTGFPGNTIAGSSLHMGIGLLATQTGSAAYKQALGVYFNPTAFFAIYVRKNDAVPNAHFGAYATSNAGDVVNTSSLAVGNIVAAYPSVFRNGVATGVDATASATFPNSQPFFVFATNNGTGSALEHTDARLGWYSIGETMTSGQVEDFNDALVALYSALSRT